MNESKKQGKILGSSVEVGKEHYAGIISRGSNAYSIGKCSTTSAELDKVLLNSGDDA